MKYWRWLLKGSSSEAGAKRFLNRWLLLHVFIGLLLGLFSPVSIDVASGTIMAPLAMLFVGFVFVWVNMQRLLESPAVRKLAKTHPGVYEKYIFTYQTAILMFLITLGFWGLGDLQIFDVFLPVSFIYYLIKSFLFFLVSITLRECWHLVLGTAKLTLLHIQKQQEDKS